MPHYNDVFFLVLVFNLFDNKFALADECLDRHVKRGVGLQRISMTSVIKCHNSGIFLSLFSEGGERHCGVARAMHAEKERSFRTSSEYGGALVS
jgi:hypothetical protein